MAGLIIPLVLRGDSAANWLDLNPILLKNQLGVEEDTGLTKRGDGETPWQLLKYTHDIDNVITTLTGTELILLVKEGNITGSIAVSDLVSYVATQIGSDVDPTTGILAIGVTGEPDTYLVTHDNFILAFT